MQRATEAYRIPETKSHSTTKLWALAERVGTITGTEPKRWLRYGETVLDRALIHLGEASGIRSKAAWLTWKIKNIAK